MEWWETALLVGFIGVLLLAAVYMMVRSTRRGRRFIKLPLPGKVRFMKALAKDPEIPAYAKGILAVAIAYLALPLDLIPDFIPVIGQLDDIFFVGIAIAMILLLVPGDRFDAALAAAEPVEPRSAPRHAPPSPPPALR
jgi:uncharacterized membrane protein YkvA (DUF1232 family)